MNLDIRVLALPSLDILAHSAILAPNQQLSDGQAHRESLD